MEVCLVADVRDCCEHALVHGKHKVGDACASNGRGTQDAFVSEVVKCADEFSCLVREC
jgi:hypothetical protein